VNHRSHILTNRLLVRRALACFEHCLWKLQNVHQWNPYIWLHFLLTVSSFLIVQHMCHLRCDEQVVKKNLRSTEVGNFYRAFLSIYFSTDMYVFANRCYQASHVRHLLPTRKSGNMRPSSVFLWSFGTQYNKLPGRTQMFIAAVCSPFIQISFFLWPFV